MGFDSSGMGEHGYLKRKCNLFIQFCQISVDSVKNSSSSPLVRIILNGYNWLVCVDEGVAPETKPFSEGICAGKQLKGEHGGNGWTPSLQLTSEKEMTLAPF